MSLDDASGVPMNLQPISPPLPAFRFQCAGCGEVSDSETGFADLSGEPFRAYYCASCAGERGAWGVDSPPAGGSSDTTRETGRAPS